jgi:hypothetical protein
MYVLVDLEAEPPTAALNEREDCTRLHVEVRGATDDAPGRTAVDRVLGDSGFGSVDGDGDDARLDLAHLRRAAGDGRPPGWEADFDAMADYARSKGWLDDSGTVQAHLVWPDN